MPHGPFSTVAARALIRAKHVTELQDALKNTPTLDENEALITATLDAEAGPVAENAVTAEIASRQLVDATGIQAGKVPRQGASGPEWIDPSGIVAPTLLLPLDGTLAGLDTDGAITATLGGSARWVDGFTDPDTAILLETAGTNLLENPYFAVNTNAWTNGAGTVARDATRAWAGPASGKITPDGVGTHAYISETDTVPISTHTLTVVVYQATGTTREFRVREGGGSWLLIGSVPSGVWTTLRTTFTGTGASVAYRFGLTGTPAVGDFCWIGYAGITAGDDFTTPIPAIDASGTSLSGYTWAGTAHASQSTRAAGSLSIPAAAFPPALTIRYSDDDGATWEHAHLTAGGAFGDRGTVAFDTDALDLTPTAQGVRVGGVRGDSRALLPDEQDDLAADDPWTWLGLPDLATYASRAAFGVEHDNAGRLTNVERPNAPFSLMSAIPGEREYPTVTKPLSAPILAFADQPAASIYWPYLVDRRAMGGSGVSLFWSTDHGTGGLYAAEADGPLDTFTARPALAYGGTGSTSETPSIIWDAANARYNVYYQRAGVGVGSQSTILATTTDFVAFTDQGIVIEMQDTIEAGDGHTGYFRPIRIGQGWYGYSIYGGTAYWRMAFWFSGDGLTWRPHPRKIGHGSVYIDHLTGYDATWRLKRHEGTVIQWRGQPWLLCLAGPSTAGGGVAPHRVVAAPLSPDLMRLGARVIDITPATQAWENGGLSGLGNALLWDERLYIPYRGSDNAAGGFGVLEVI